MMFKMFKNKMILIAASVIIVTIIGLFTIGWIQTFGWLYSGAFALSAIPQSLKSIKEGNSRGVADGTLLLWTLGEVGGFVYGIGLMQWPIIFNCGMNAFWVGIILYYRLFPKN